ncbi:hypothetical protein [Metabacillus halosaccharovorans]|uniref:hypothetical protein n=1 Tax=Metabacillus halosaccharovorans TaxID=930124 RepID=UPI001C1FEC9B|nr:hypothetical protein [Metabacillus halosaccharovorans]MBU7592279.1 hypothetical protein [Metabacillus halosaccharovorans]
MNQHNTKTNDTTQLNQRLIYYKSELAKYKSLVEDYQNNYHYSLLRKLKTENRSLLDQIQDKSLQLNNMTKKYETMVEQHELNIRSISEKEENSTRLIEDQKEEIVQLIEENNKHKYRLIEKEKQETALKNEYSKILLKMKNVEKEIQAEKMSRETQEKKVHTLQQEIDKITKDKQKIELYNKELDYSLKDKIVKLERYETSDIILREKIATLETVNKSITEQLNEIKNFNSDLESFKTNLQSENKSLSMKNNNLEVQLKELKEHNDHFLTKMDILIQQNEDYLIISESYKKHESKLIQIQNIQQHILATIEKLQDNFSSLIPRISSLRLDQLDNSDLSVLLHLEHQFKKILEYSLEYEGKIDAKTILINELEIKLDEFTKEIEMMEHQKKESL